MLREGHYTGVYRTPAIGPESPIQNAEHCIAIDDNNVITVQSPLWVEPYTIGDGKTFSDPRADSFLQIATIHQFHHFTTRQLSFVEDFETRAGTSRFVRLGGLLDSARLLQSLGATFEQIVQTVVSDFAHPAGSHLRGDFMVGDYEKQDSHDDDLWQLLLRSGFVKELQQVGLLDAEGYLAGSACQLEDLADPRHPRWQDIVECDRPDGNADRIPFTMHEGVLIHDPAEVREAMRAITRVETRNGDRMAVNDAEAARLLYLLAVRHQSESWGEPLHRAIEELVLLPDRYAFCTPHQSTRFRILQDYYPVDYARTDEQTWYDTITELGQIDTFIPSVLAIARRIAHHQREVSLGYVGDNHAYKGPVVPEGVSVKIAGDRKHDQVTVHHEDTYSEIWLALRRPKYRGPIDSLVITKNGLKRISEIDPSLKTYEQQRKEWIVPLLAKIVVPSAIGRELEYGVRLVNRHWSDTASTRQHQNPVLRKPMPAEQIESQIELARARTFSEARVC